MSADAAWAALEERLRDAPQAMADDALGDALLDALFGSGRPVLALETLAAILRRREAQGPLQHEGWAQVAAHLAAQLPGLLARGDHLTLLGAIAAIGLAEGRGAALRRLFALVLAAPPEAGLETSLHRRMWRCGLLGPAESAGFLASLAPALPQEEGARLRDCRRLLALLGLDQPVPFPYAEALVEGLALPWLLQAAREDQAVLALELEGLLHAHWLKREESAAHHARWIGRWAPALAECGRRRARPLAARPPAPGQRPVVVFLAHVASGLAHVQAMLTLLEAAMQRPGRRFDYRVQFLYGRDEAVFARLGAAGVGVVAQATPPGTPLALALERCAALLAADPPAALVWLCAPQGLAYGFGRRLAPVQLWWSVKFHPPAAPDADLRIGGFAGQGPRVMVEGVPWANLPGSIDPQLRAVPEAERQALRARFGEGVLLGSLAREEKMADPGFQQVVLSVLQRVPGARYLYTGREDLPEFRARLEAAGVAERAHFVGWVETGLYAGILDVYLDSFPLGGGLTAMQAMVQGVAPVFLCGAPGAPYGGVLDNYLHRARRSAEVPAAERAARDALLRDAAGRDLVPVVADEAAYLARAVALAGDAALRRQVGQAVARYAEAWLTDHGLPARVFEALLTEACGLPDASGVRP
ncbi:hypothetical protein [Pseudoroseomonas cervicalis]|uniref:hypothetical protein n=1 Tax=Teichococcus cervicalis TaxID=204525 RepID=UPI0022F1B072|nr:hypothetical protein [Pseudoroseomonas cervicalis]WBV45505.1 hypothetical protein PFY06_21745 [Pseudoroseomonas cervicalis]